jgi:hypothetical protein
VGLELFCTEIFHPARSVLVKFLHSVLYPRILTGWLGRLHSHIVDWQHEEKSCPFHDPNHLACSMTLQHGKS